MSASPIAKKTFTEPDGTEREFVFSKLAATDAVKVAHPLMRVVPALMKAVGAARSQKATDTASMLAALSGAGGEVDLIQVMVDGITSIPPDELVPMMQTTFKSVTLAGQVVDMDVHFGGGLSKTMLMVFAEALRVNFADFFGAARSGSSPAGQTAA